MQHASQATLLVTRKRWSIWAAEQSATDYTDQIREIRGYLKKQEWNLVIDGSDCRDRITSSYEVLLDHVADNASGVCKTARST